MVRRAPRRIVTASRPKAAAILQRTRPARQGCCTVANVRRQPACNRAPSAPGPLAKDRGRGLHSVWRPRPGPSWRTRGATPYLAFENVPRSAPLVRSAHRPARCLPSDSMSCGLPTECAAGAAKQHPAADQVWKQVAKARTGPYVNPISNFRRVRPSGEIFCARQGSLRVSLSVLLRVLLQPDGMRPFSRRAISRRLRRAPLEIVESFSRRGAAFTL